jgi:AcrR family transcriptional regulator
VTTNPVRGAPTHKKRGDEILEAAIKVFYERGYADATVQDVANEVGILKGSLYHYIATKEDLLFQLFEVVHEQVESIKVAAEAADELNPIERLELYIHRQLEYNLANIQRISVYYHDLGLLGPERLAYVQAERRTHNRFVTRLIQEGQDQGLADASLDARMLANCVFATIIWTYRWYRIESRTGREDIVALCESFALHGIGLRAQK